MLMGYVTRELELALRVKLWRNMMIDDFISCSWKDRAGG
jgi:hypothetical protein